MEILIFKTDIKSETAFKKAARVLNAVPTIVKWTIDRTDVENVLRIEATGNNSSEIMRCLQQVGCDCEVLVYSL